MVELLECSFSIQKKKRENTSCILFRRQINIRKNQNEIDKMMKSDIIIPLEPIF